MPYVRPQTVYEVKARRISGTRDEKLEQIDVAMQELLDIRTLEGAGATPNLRFLAVPRPRSHSYAMTVAFIVMLAVLALVLGVRAARAQDPAPQGDPAPAQQPQPQDPQLAQPQPPQEPAPKPKKADPFAFADFTWLSGNPRTKESPLDTKVFTGEFRVDTNYPYSFNHPSDDTIGGSTEVFRSGEFQLTQLGVGGDFHYDNVQGRLMTQFGMYAETTPRNDASPGRGQWDLNTAYRYLSEAYGYHLDTLNDVNLQAGIFMSYIDPFKAWNTQTNL